MAGGGYPRTGPPWARRWWLLTVGAESGPVVGRAVGMMGMVPCRRGDGTPVVGPDGTPVRVWRHDPVAVWDTASRAVMVPTGKLGMVRRSRQVWGGVSGVSA